MIVSECARSTVAGMRKADVRQLMIVSAAVLFRNEGILFAILRRTLLRNVADDQTEMERLVTESGLDWTIIRPPRLTNGPLTKHYQVEDNRMPRPRLSVSRADVAHFLLDEVERGAHRNQMVGMAGTRA
jgi:putative NADH-flavin reductase